MSIQVLNIAAAMGDKNTMNSMNSMKMNQHHSLGLAGLQRDSSPVSTSNASSPILSAIAARNANHLAQLRALSITSSSPSRTAGLLATVSQESMDKRTLTASGTASGNNNNNNNTSTNSNSASVSANNASGIVSHLRSRNHQVAAAAAQERKDIESLSLLRAKAAMAAAASGSWALSGARALPHSLFAPGNASLLNNSLAPPPAPLLSDLYPSEALLTKILRLTTTPGVNASPLGSPYMCKTVLSASSLDKSNGSNAARKSPNHAPIPLYMDCDEDSLSEYQCLIRQQMELFEATSDDAAASVQGRNKQILPGQVGIRCRHCARSNRKGLVVGSSSSSKGSMYFPTKLDRIYQAAQNLSAFHLCDHCPHVPPEVRKRILLLRERKSPAGGGKRYWAEGVRCLGVVEDAKKGGLRFKSSSAAKPQA